MFYRARYYNSIIGRFISEDPIRLSVSEKNNFVDFQESMTAPVIFPTYTYVGGSPLEYRDPNGLLPKPLNAVLCFYYGYKCTKEADKCKKEWCRIFTEIRDKYKNDDAGDEEAEYEIWENYLSREGMPPGYENAFIHKDCVARNSNCQKAVKYCEATFIQIKY